ncbi:MAG: sulfur oxidation c-type cytochrome SoxX, partial [Caldimonas sp.]
MTHFIRRSTPAGTAAAIAIAAAIVAGCATPPAVDYDKVARDMLTTSFRAQGQAGLDRLQQDDMQRICSGPAEPSAQDVERVQAAALATIRPPAGARYLGDWKEGEKLAQNGRGMTWTDPADAPAGGNCYNCHQMSKAEISFGTLGPSLYQYGKLR